MTSPSKHTRDLIRERVKPLPIQHVDLYTDGSYSQQGRGGFGVILLTTAIDTLYRRDIADQLKHCNSPLEAELIAVIKGLASLRRVPCRVDIYTDAQRIVDVMETRWYQRWETRKWQGVHNGVLWRTLIAQASKHQVTWHWVKAHADNDLNNQCDLLAKTAMRNGLAVDRKYEVKDND